MPLDAGTRLGPYEILGLLGSGGMGEVYRARDTRLDRTVAVKVLPAHSASALALERFGREAKAIAALSHPGICIIHDVGTEPVPFLVMELLEGETLHQRLGRGPMDVPTIVEIGMVLADALASAHAKGILHRDLKPANIVLTPRGPKILDFGLARITESASSDAAATISPTRAAQTPLTDIGVAVGTVAYMSPEQLRSEPLDGRTDIFSLGVVLYEMATGRRAFTGATSAVTSAAILHEQPASPRQHRPDLPPRLDQVILTMLEKDRDVRMQTAAELRAELLRLKRELGPPYVASDGAISAAVLGPPSDRSAPVSVTPPSSSDAQLLVGVLQRHRRLVISAAAVLLVIIIAAGYLMSRTGGDETNTTGTSLTLADLQLEQLTTSGTAGAPAISPDGKYVAYVEQGERGDSVHVRMVATESTVPILPVEPGVRLASLTVTPDGNFITYLRIVAGQAIELWRIPFLGGEPPRRLVQRIGSGVSFSPQGNRMAYLRAAPGGHTEMVVANPDGSGEQVLSTRGPNESFWLALPGLGAFAPAWSPDGKTIAALGAQARGPDRPTPTGQVVFVDVQTGSQHAANAGPPLLGSALAWIDERSLVVSMLDRSSAPLQLWLLSFPEGQFRRLTNDLIQYVGAKMTADGNILATVRNEAAFTILTSDASADRWSESVSDAPMKGPVGFGIAWLRDDLIYPASTNSGFALMRWQGSTRTATVVARSAGDPSVSRDESTVAFFEYDMGANYKMDASGEHRTRLTAGLGPRRRLTPDGRHVVSVVTDGAKPPVIALFPVDNEGTRRVLAADRVAASGFAEVSPDGRLVAFSAVDDRSQPVIAVCDLVACSSRRTLPNAGRWHWTPDSTGIAYVDLQFGSDVWIQPIDGRAPRQLIRFARDGRQIADFAWSADGGRIAVARARISNNIVLFRGFRRLANNRLPTKP